MIFRKLLRAALILLGAVVYLAILARLGIVNPR